MGYDVTYHPISREEMFEWYFEPLRNDTAIDRLAEKHGFLAENYRHYIRSAKRHIEDADQNASFESVHGLMIAVGQGLMRRYDYFRGCLFTRLVEEDPRFKEYVQSFSTFVPEEYKSMRFANGIEENWCGGVYIPPEAVSSLIHDIENDPSIRNAVLRNFGNEEELNRFLNLLRYAESNKLGVLEATEVVFPFAGNCMSDFGNCEPGFMERITVSPFLATPNCFSTETPIQNGKYYLDEGLNLHENVKSNGEAISFDSNTCEKILEQIQRIKVFDRKRLIPKVKSISGEILKHRILPAKDEFWPTYIGCGVLGILSLAASIYIPPFGSAPLGFLAPWILWGLGILLIGIFVLLTIIVFMFPAPKNEEKMIVLEVDKLPITIGEETKAALILQGPFTFNCLDVNLICSGPVFDNDGKVEMPDFVLFNQCLLSVEDRFQHLHDRPFVLDGLTFCPEKLPSITSPRWEVEWKIIVYAGMKNTVLKKVFPLVVLDEVRGIQ